MTRPDSDEWLKAKAQGDQAELSIAGWFRGQGYLVAKTVGATAASDLLVQTQVEVKHDLLAESSGRVAIEISYRGHPSGLTTSQAAWWAIVVGQEVFLLKADALRECIRIGKYPTCLGGDNKSSKLVLLPIAVLRGLKQTFNIPLSK